MISIKRKATSEIEEQLQKSHFLLQVIVGPRQVGKTTAAHQIIQSLKWNYHFASADLPRPPDASWIESQWKVARQKEGTPVLLVLDEIQKVSGWSETIKALWDEEKAYYKKVKVLLLGSSVLLVQKGLTESLAGRFYLHRFTHWSYEECKTAFGFNLEKWIYFGGYPGALEFLHNEAQWKRYITDALIDTVLSRDIFQLESVAKPALFKQLFTLAASCPAQILSYNKMLGQLMDAGNTTTLAHYLELLGRAFLVSGLQLFSQGTLRKKASSPKLILWNNALINAFSLYDFEATLGNSSWWGRLVENSVGAHLLNHLQGLEWNLTYWREKDKEVDFVLERGKSIWAIEVKSGLSKNLSGLTAFKKTYPKAKNISIGSGGIPLEDFFSTHPETWLLP